MTELIETVTKADYDAVVAERDVLKEETDRDLDRVVHYRNLALELGAKPEHMLNKFDRDLAKKWGGGQGYDAAEEIKYTCLLWEENERLESENARLTQELKAAEEEIEQAILTACERCRNPKNEPWRSEVIPIRWFHVGGVICEAYPIRERRHQRLAEKQSV